jgi:hypothetical protein
MNPRIKQESLINHLRVAGLTDGAGMAPSTEDRGSYEVGVACSNDATRRITPDLAVPRTPRGPGPVASAGSMPNGRIAEERVGGVSVPIAAAP